jgi:hypothetical protein
LRLPAGEAGGQAIAVNHFPRHKILSSVPESGVNWPWRSNSLKVKAEQSMNVPSYRAAAWFALVLIPFLSWNAGAQSCQTSGELEDATRAAMTAAAQKYFGMAASGDSASLRQSAIPSLASDFSGIEATVKEQQPNLSGAQPTVKSSFLLDASGVAPIPHAEFYCGVFGKNGQTANSAAFYLDNLPAGKYAVVLFDATSAKGKTMFS